MLNFKIRYSLFLDLNSFVRIIGVEPTWIAPPDPKSGASANFAISALVRLLSRNSRETTFAKGQQK